MANPNTRQKDALDVVLKSHNLVICGQAGTGKSFVLRHVVAALQECGKNVAVTATTGIASQQFSRFGATTLHSWAGIQDGRYTVEELKRLLMDDERFKDARERLISTDCLVLDEMSMLSAKLFELLEGITRYVRKKDAYFGGMQVIFAGDFYQLPPVKNAMYHEEGKFCFTSSLWSKVFPHTIQFNEVLRQDERPLIQAINEAAVGVLSPTSVNLLATLKRPIECPPGDTIVKLYATNQQADIENTNSVLDMPGEMVTYNAVDEGEQHHLRRSIIAPKVIHLKRGCPVMLLRNLSKELVNGSLGRVVDFGEEGPVIHFVDSDKIMEVKRMQFSVYNPQLKANIANRSQIPIKPAFGLTVHKSQGMTLKYVMVDCHMINRPGQLGVSLGRAQTIAGLQVLHFHRSCCITQPETVRQFYANVEKEDGAARPVLADTSCCRTSSDMVISTEQATVPAELEDYYQDSDNDCDLSDDDMQEIDGTIESQVVTEEVYTLPAGFDVPALLKSVKYSPCHTQYQQNINSLLTIWEQSPAFPKFLAWEKRKVCAIVSAHTAPGVQLAQREQTAMYAAFASHMQSSEHKTKCQQLFSSGTNTPEAEAYNAVYRVLVELRRREISAMAQTMQAESRTSGQVVRRLPSEKELTDGGKGKIRYIGGFFLAKIRYKFQQQTSRLVFQLDGRLRERMRRAHQKVLLLSMLTLTEAQAQLISQDKGSLGETSRRQNLSQGLTHISDSTYRFFFDLCNSVIHLQTPSNLQQYGEGLGDFVLTNVQDDGEGMMGKLLRENFNDLFSDSEDHDPAMIRELYDDITSLFCRVMIKQFRKDYLASVQKKKGLAHRKKVIVGDKRGQKGTSIGATKGVSSGSVVSFDDIMSDQTPDKSDTHTSLKTLAEHNQLSQIKIKKVQLQTLCRAYAVIYKSQDTVSVLINKLQERIKVCSCMNNVSVLGGVSQTERRGSKRKADSDFQNTCRECQQSYKGNDEEEPWIQCDVCKRWFHRTCAEIYDDEEWYQYTENESRFVCSYC